MYVDVVFVLIFFGNFYVLVKDEGYGIYLILLRVVEVMFENFLLVIL